LYSLLRRNKSSGIRVSINQYLVTHRETRRHRDTKIKVAKSKRTSGIRVSINQSISCYTQGDKETQRRKI
jgi:hypothetical protein